MAKTILIVDDEQLIREGLAARIEYLGIKFDKVLQAENGAVALKVLKKEPVDICIVDMQMPEMSGLQFIEAISTSHPQIQSIVLSGHAQFDYAQNALRFGAKAYLLKPVDDKELRSAIISAIRDIDRQEANLKMQSAKDRLERVKINYDYEKELNDYLVGDWEITNQHFPYLSEFLEKTERCYYTGIIQIADESYQKRTFLKEDVSVLIFAMKNILEDVYCFSEFYYAEDFANKGKVYCIFSIENDSKNEQEIFYRDVKQVKDIMETSLDISVLFSFSSLHKDFNKQSVKEARDAVMLNLSSETNGICFYDKLYDNKGALTSIELKSISRNIENLELSKIRDDVNIIFSQTTIDKYGAYSMSVFWSQIINMLVEPHSDKSSITYEQLIENINIPDNLNSLEKIAKAMWEIIVSVIHNDGLTEQNTKSKMHSCVKFIEDNYDSDISINDLSSRFDMTPSYFSSIFRKEIGQSPLTYITNVKIEKAKDLLKNTSKSVVEVANSVGYEDSHYFFRVFKKATGVTPLQFRKDF